MKCTIAGLVFIALPVLSAAGQVQPSQSPFKGKYVVTRNADECAPSVTACSFCPAFLKNLNEFRDLDFNACHPRLSPKYPEFTRPVWEEIPFDLSLAETIIRNVAATGQGDTYWTGWLKASAPLRAKGKITLWRTRIDIDGDGVPETVLRLDSPLRLEYRAGGVLRWAIDPNACTYRNSTLYLLESPNDFTKGTFNRMALDIGDIIIRRVAGHPDEYYAPARNIFTFPTRSGKNAGREMPMHWLTANSAGDICHIIWIPAGD